LRGLRRGGGIAANPISSAAARAGPGAGNCRTSAIALPDLRAEITIFAAILLEVKLRINISRAKAQCGAHSPSGLGAIFNNVATACARLLAGASLIMLAICAPDRALAACTGVTGPVSGNTGVHTGVQTGVHSASTATVAVSCPTNVSGAAAGGVKNGTTTTALVRATGSHHVASVTNVAKAVTHPKK
jgi:hypothetical protein